LVRRRPKTRLHTRGGTDCRTRRQDTKIAISNLANWTDRIAGGAKYIDGRIDDPNAGWKGRALWSTDGNRTPFHRETGKGTLPKIVKFQVRPDPLAH
jgi:hypothetical protein